MKERWPVKQSLMMWTDAVINLELIFSAKVFYVVYVVRIAKLEMSEYENLERMFEKSCF